MSEPHEWTEIGQSFRIAEDGGYIVMQSKDPSGWKTLRAVPFAACNQIARLAAELAEARAERKADRELIAELADALDSIPHLSDEMVAVLARARSLSEKGAGATGRQR